jgi:DNA repair exonuclease SbcCD ATPase subunit
MTDEVHFCELTRLRERLRDERRQRDEAVIELNKAKARIAELERAFAQVQEAKIVTELEQARQSRDNWKKCAELSGNDVKKCAARIAVEGIIVEILEDSRGSPPDGSPIMIDQGLLAHAAKLVKWGLYALKEPADG